MPHTISLFLALAALWLFASGIYTPLLLGLGLLSCVFVIWLANRVDVNDHEGFPLHLHPARWVAYVGWLIWEIVKSNVDVARRILDPALPISPSITRVPAKMSEVSRVIYANSITLTPGTVAVEVDDESVLVHSLTREGAQSLEHGTMHDKVDRLERTGGNRV